MAEAKRRSALQGHDVAGPVPTGAGVIVSELRVPAMALIQGAHDGEALRDALSAFNLLTTPAARRVCGGEGLRLMWIGPGQYLVLSWRHRDAELERSLATALAPQGAVAVDLTQARSVFRLEGERAIDVLAKGCPLDLEAMSDGDSAATVLGHFNLSLARRGEGFDLLVFRSFGLACFEWLLEAGHEYAIAVGEPA